MKSIHKTLVLLAITLVGLTTAYAQDPLASWNDGPAKKSITDFVAKVTKEGSPDFVSLAERVATFDNDGTLWCEKPMPIQLFFALDRVKTLAPQHPEWKTKEPFASLLKGDVKGAMAGGEHSGGIEFMRPWTEKVYGIPPEQVVGSSGKTKYEIRDGQPVLLKLPEINFIDDKEGKPVGINQHIGRKPVLSAGNVFSGGDIAMLRYCQSHTGPTLQLMVNHDDAAREFAYAEPDNASLKAAAANGWMVVSMKDDWKNIFAFEGK